MRIERREYVEAVQYYQCDFNEKELEYLNKDIKVNNPDFVELTMEDIENYIHDQTVWNRGSEEISTGLYMGDKPFVLTLEGYVYDYLCDLLWSNQVNFEIKQMYEQEDYILED